MSETTQDLVQQGLTAARVGDMEEARRLLTQATEKMPENIEAWLALAGVVTSLEEKKTYFSKALDLDPNNAEAREGVTRVEQKLAEARAKAVPSTGLGYCYRHPDIETGLRCNRCNKFICPKCAQRSPVGFRCPDCVRVLEDKYYTGTNTDYIIAAVIALPLSLILAGLFSIILSGLGIFLLLIIGIFVAPVATGLIAEAVRWGVGKRRSRYLRHVVIACLVLGTAPFILGLGFMGGIYSLMAPAIFLFFGIATISARLR
jgi:hypothetical protein